MSRARLSVLFLLALCVACRGEPSAVSASTTPPSTLRLGFGGANVALLLGMQVRLPVVVVGAAGDTVTTPLGVSLISRNATVVRVDSGTFVRSMAMGTTWIVASVGVAGQTLVDSLQISVVCTAELRITLAPRTQTLAVGESFTPLIALSTCGGQIPIMDLFRWSVSDTAVLHVDSLTGLSIGLRPGQTPLHVRGLSNGALGDVIVTVQPSP